MKTRTLIGFVAVALFGASVSSSFARSRPAASRSCAPRYGVSVLLSDQHAQVYQDGVSIYGCLRRNRHYVYLGPDAGGWDECQPDQDRCGTLSEEVLTDSVVAYVESSHAIGGGTEPQRIVVRSIAAGDVLHKFSLRVAVPRETMIETALALRLLLSGNGSVAWLQQDSFGVHGGGPSPPTSYNIYAVDSSGSHSLTDDLATPPESLRLVGSMLSWRQEGVRGHAALD